MSSGIKCLAGLAKCAWGGKLTGADHKDIPLYEGRGTLRLANGDVIVDVIRYPNGDIYKGEFKAGLAEGRGVYRFANGNVYEGEFKAGKREGRGVIRWANGNMSSGFFKQNAPVGEGVAWMADGWRAVYQRDGKMVKYILPEAAQRAAEQLYLPIPSPLPGA